MDAGMIKLISDAGTVAVVLFILWQVLIAYKAIVSRLADLLETEIKNDPSENSTNKS
jgi:hypothetical protein